LSPNFVFRKIFIVIKNEVIAQTSEYASECEREREREKERERERKNALEQD